MPNLSKAMKMMILSMPKIPKGMQEGFLKMDINSSGSDMMNGHKHKHGKREAIS